MIRKFCIAVLAVLLCGVASPVSSQNTNVTSYVNFSFDQADIKLLVKLVGDLTGKRFIVDDTVSGKVTVVSPPQIPREEVYPLFVTILESSGYTVIERDNVCHVVALPQEEVTGAPVVGPDEKVTQGGIITKVIRLQNINAADVKKTLDPLIRGGKTGALAAFGPSNHLIVTDTVGNIARLERIVAELDKPGAARIAEVIKLKYASAEDVAIQILTAMKGAETAEARLSRRVAQMADGSVTLPTDVVVVPSTQANSLVVVGASVQIEELKRVIAMIDVESPSGYGRLNAIFLKYLTADDAAKGINALLAKSIPKDGVSRISIEPSSANNALMIDASPQDYEIVRALVERLDTMPQQVMVEVIIAEVSMDKGLDLSVEWATVDEPADERTTVIGRTRTSETDALLDIVKNGIFPQGLAVGVSQGATVASDGTVYPNMFVFLRALAENRDVKILSNIPLWAQDNTEASVSVVDNIPILKSTIEGGSGTSRDVIQNIERLDVGIKLKMTPHINPDNEIRMQLNPSIEAIIQETSGDIPFTPVIAKREVSTTVTVKDKSTVIISGLIREDRVKNVSKIPLLGDIPILGILFRSTRDVKQKTNLLVFVTPHIVTDMKEAQALRKSLEERTQMQGVSTNVSMDTTKE